MPTWGPARLRSGRPGLAARIGPDTPGRMRIRVGALKRGRAGTRAFWEDAKGLCLGEGL